MNNFQNSKNWPIRESVISDGAIVITDFKNLINGFR